MLLLVLLQLAVGVVVATAATMVALAEALPFLILRIGPLGDEVAKLFEVRRPVLRELAVEVTIGHVVLEDVAHFTLRELDAGGLLLP